MQCLFKMILMKNDQTVELNTFNIKFTIMNGNVAVKRYYTLHALCSTEIILHENKSKVIILN